MNCLITRRFVFLLFCVIHGFAVLGITKFERCKNVSPDLHFIYAFQHYNWRYFTHPLNNYNASNYFEELLKFHRYSQVYYNFPPPREFCYEKTDKPLCHEALYMVLADKSLPHDDEVTRILTELSGFQAFKHVYRKIIYKRITYSNVFPEQQNKPTMETYGEDFQQYKRAIQIWAEENKKKLTIFGYMAGFLQETLNVANQLARHVKFETVDNFCLENATGPP